MEHVYSVCQLCPCQASAACGFIQFTQYSWGQPVLCWGVMKAEGYQWWWSNFGFIEVRLFGISTFVTPLNRTVQPTQHACVHVHTHTHTLQSFLWQYLYQQLIPCLNESWNICPIIGTPKFLIILFLGL